MVDNWVTSSSAPEDSSFQDTDPAMNRQSDLCSLSTKTPLLDFSKEVKIDLRTKIWAFSQKRY